MSEEELQLLITLDDPVDGPEEDAFHLQDKNKLECWPDQPCQVDQGTEDVGDNDASGGFARKVI